MRHRCDAPVALGAILVLAAGALVPTAVAGASVRPLGASFHVRYAPPGATTFADVACPSPTVCFAVGGGVAERGAVFKTSNGARSWARLTTPSGMVSISAISCPTTRFCLAVGQGPYEPYLVSTHDGGATWSQWIDSSLFNETVSQLVCLTPSNCLATLGIGELVRSKDGGNNWVQVRTPQLASVTSIACAAPSTCTAVGVAALAGSIEVDRSTNAAATFSAVGTFAAANPSRAQIACGTAQSCLLAGAGPSGSTVEGTLNAGRSWHLGAAPAIVANALSVSCTSTGACSVAGVSSGSNLVVASTTASLSSWTATSVAHANNAASSPGGLSCTRAGCVIVGFGTTDNALFVRSGAAATFHRITTAAGPSSLDGVTCPTDARCVAVGAGTALLSVTGGVTWAPATGIPASAQLDAVACPAPTTCIAVGDLERPGMAAFATAFRSTDGGASWSRVGVPSGHASLSAIACVTATTCVAVSSDGAPSVLRTTDAGARYSVVPVGAEHTISLSSIACPTATTCVAVGVDPFGGVAVTTEDGGTTWSAGSGATGLGDYLQAVSCLTATSCLAAGALQPVGPGVESTVIYSTSDGAATWSAMPSAPASFDVGALACLGSECEELATPEANFGPPSSTLESTANAGGSWSVTALPSVGILPAVAVTPAGRWVLVGTSALNGALVVTTS